MQPDTDAQSILSQMIVAENDPAKPEPCELAQKWKFRTLKDAYTERPPMRYIVDGLIPEGSLSIVYGGPGSLKSMILADMAVCVAAGIRWLDPLDTDRVKPGRTFITTKCPILWIDFDNGTRRTDERFDAMAKSRSLPDDLPLRYISMPDPWLDASNRGMIAQLAELIKQEKIKLIFIDNLGLITGDTEENSAEMSKVMGNLRNLCELTGASIIIIHHQRKSSASSNGDGRRGDSLRGHSTIEASLDLALLVDRKDGTDSIAIIPTKVRGPSIDLFSAMFTYTHREGTSDLEQARFFSNAPESPEQKQENGIRDTVIFEIELAQRELREIGQAELVQRVQDKLAVNSRPPGKNRVRGIINEMVSDGLISEQSANKKTATNAVIYKVRR